METVVAAVAFLDVKIDDCLPEAWLAAAELALVRRRAIDLKPNRVRWPLVSQMERPQVISSKT